jgi:hypothetical protein
VDWQAIITALVSLLSAAAGAYAMLRKMRGEIDKQKADTSKTAAEAWVMLVQEQRQEINGLRQEMDELKAMLMVRDEQRMAERAEYNTRIDELELEIMELREWIMTQGLIPPERKSKRKK